MKKQLIKTVVINILLLFFSQAQAKNLEYAYLYSTQARTININGPIPFDINGYKTSNIVHAPGSTTIKVKEDGLYKITYSISSVQPNQIALYKNNALVAGSIFGSGNRIQQNTGYVILALDDNDILSIVNVSPTTLNLQTFAGGSNANVNACITIEQLDTRQF